MFAAAGADPGKIKYLEGGWPAWGTVLRERPGRRGARVGRASGPDWEGKGLKFEYWLGLDHSNFPANSFVVRRFRRGGIRIGTSSWSNIFAAGRWASSSAT